MELCRCESVGLAGPWSPCCQDLKMDLSCVSARSGSGTGQLPLRLVLGFSLLSCTEFQLVSLLAACLSAWVLLFSALARSPLTKQSWCLLELAGPSWALTQAKLLMALGRLPGLQEMSPGLHLQLHVVTEITTAWTVWSFLSHGQGGLLSAKQRWQ